MKGNRDFEAETESARHCLFCKWFEPAGCRRSIRQMAALLVLALVPTLLCGFFHPHRPSWSAEALAPGEVALSTALSWKNKVLWLDARSEKDFRENHVPGALPLNEDDWDALLAKVLDAWSDDKIIVVYCSSLGCHASHEVARRLREEVGLKQVYVLKGGWETWKAAQK